MRRPRPRQHCRRAQRARGMGRPAPPRRLLEQTSPRRPGRSTPWARRSTISPGTRRRGGGSSGARTRRCARP
eukprot:3423172-Alexandrium_andersonii.AAC.1